MPEEQPTSTGFKLLIGCAALGGAAVLLCVLLVMAGVWWMVSPGKQLDTLSLTGPNTVAVIHAIDLSNDPATRAYLDENATYFATASQTVQTSQLPEHMEWARKFQNTDPAAAASTFSRLIPTDFAYVVNANGSEETYSVAVNFQVLVRFFAAVLTSDPEGHRARNGELSTYRDRDILQMDSNSLFAFEGGTLIGADTVEALHQVIDDVIDGNGESPLNQELALLHEEWPVAGVSQNEDWFLDTLMGTIAVEGVDALDSAQDLLGRMWFGLRLDDPDTLTLRIGMEQVNEVLVEGWEQLLTNYSCPSLEAELREASLEPACTVSRSGQDFTVDIRATGLRAATRAAIDSSLQQ